MKVNPYYTPGLPIKLEYLTKLVYQVADAFLDHVVTCAQEKFKVGLSDLQSPSKRWEFVVPRFFCYRLVREVTDASFKHIGEVFGGRNHSTVINGIHKLSDLIQTDKKVEKQFNDFKELTLTTWGNRNGN